MITLNSSFGSSPLQTTLEVLWFIPRALTMQLNLNFAVHSLILAGTFGATTTVLSFVNMQQLQQQVQDLGQPRCGFTAARFRQYHASLATSLRLLQDVNRVYGPAIGGFVAINLPLNAMLTVMLILGGGERFPPSARPLLAFVLLVQFVFVFGLAVVVARLAIMLHSGAKKVLSLSCGAQQLEKSRKSSNNSLGWSVKAGWKVATYIELFHTGNLHTITYGNCAKITYQTVAKVGTGDFMAKNINFVVI